MYLLKYSSSLFRKLKFSSEVRKVYLCRMFEDWRSGQVRACGMMADDGLRGNHANDWTRTNEAVQIHYS